MVVRRARLVLCLLLVLPAPAAVAGAATGRPSAVGAGATELVWGPVMTLDETSRGSRDVAVNVLGDSVVVWSRHARRASSIFARYRPAEGTWGASARLGFGTAPQVALDARGSATAIWSTHPDGWGDAVHASRRPRRTGVWTDPVVLSTPAREPGYKGLDHWHDDTFPLSGHVGAGRAMLGANARGDAAVAWHYRADGDEPDGNDFDFVVQAVHRPAGGRWSDVMAVSEPRPPRRVKSAPHAIGIDRRGAVTVMWVRYDDRTSPTSGSIRVRRMRPTGRWTPEVVLDRRGYDGTDWFEDRDWYNDLAVSPVGHAMAVFGRFSVRQAGGTWTRGREIRTRRQVETADTPFLSMDRDGTAYAATYPAGVLVKPLGERWRWRGVPSLGAAWWLTLEGNARGDVLLFGRGENDEVVAAYRSRGGAVVEDVMLADDTFGSPVSAVFPRGRAIVVWATRDRRIQVRELLPSG